MDIIGAADWIVVKKKLEEIGMSTHADKLLRMGYDSMACFPDPSAVGAEAKVAKIADELLGTWGGSGHKAKFVKKFMEVPPPPPDVCGRCKGDGKVPCFVNCLSPASHMWNYKENKEKGECEDCDSCLHHQVAFVGQFVLIGTLCCFCIACRTSKCDVCDGKGKLKVDPKTGIPQSPYT